VQHGSERRVRRTAVAGAAGALRSSCEEVLGALRWAELAGAPGRAPVTAWEHPRRGRQSSAAAVGRSAAGAHGRASCKAGLYFTACFCLKIMDFFFFFFLTLRNA